MHKYELSENLLKILWFGILCSIFILYAVSHTIIKTEVPFSTDQLISHHSESQMFYGIMLVLIVVIINIHKLLTYQAHCKQTKLQDPKKIEMEYISTQFILKIALSEAIAVLGFVLVLQNQNPNLITLPTCISIILLLYYYPILTSFKRKIGFKNTSEI